MSTDGPPSTSLRASPRPVSPESAVETSPTSSTPPLHVYTPPEDTKLVSKTNQQSWLFVVMSHIQLYFLMLRAYASYLITIFDHHPLIDHFLRCIYLLHICCVCMFLLCMLDVACCPLPRLVPLLDGEDLHDEHPPHRQRSRRQPEHLPPGSLRWW